MEGIAEISFFWASLVAQMVKRLPGMRETQVWPLVWEDPLEKEMATHSSTLTWKIPWTEEPVRLQSMGSLRVGHDWATSLSLFLLVHLSFWRRTFLTRLFRQHVIRLAAGMISLLLNWHWVGSGGWGGVHCLRAQNRSFGRLHLFLPWDHLRGACIRPLWVVEGWAVCAGPGSFPVPQVMLSSWEELFFFNWCFCGISSSPFF